MKARIYLPGRHGESIGWHDTEADDPPLPEMRLPVMTAGGIGQLVLRLVAIENGMAVYL